MAMRLPTVEGPSVAPQGVDSRSAYQSTPAGLGGAAAVQARQIGQVAQVADAYLDMRRKEQNRDDLDSVFRAETGLKEDYLKFERDELGKYGANAKGAGERAAQWWGEAEKKYGEGLTERQAFAFKRSATQLRIASSSTLARHEQHQSNESLKESSTARIGTAIQTATADPTDERVANSRKEITEAVNITSNLAGDTPEVRERKLAEALTMMHKGVVTRLADSSNPDDLDRAKAYYYTHKKEIDGTSRAVIEKTLERSSVLTEAQTAVDELRTKFGDDLPAAMKHIEATYTGEKEKAVKAEYTSRYTTDKAGKQAISQTAYETALLHTVQGQRVPNAVWNQMDDGHKAAIIEKREAEEKARRAAAEGKPIKTDFTTWNKLNRMATDDPKAFVAFDLGRVADKISGGDLQEFGNLQRKLRSGDEKPHKEIVSVSQQVDVALDGLALRANTPEQAAARKAIYDALTAEQAGRDNKTPLTYDERQKVIDRQIMKAVSSPGMVWDTTKRVYQMTPEERAKAEPTSEDRKVLVERFKKAGVAKPTDEQINEAFRRWKGL
jgi:hypothetical protein